MVCTACFSQLLGMLVSIVQTVTGYSPASSFQPCKSGAISSSPYLYNLDDIPDVRGVNFQMCVGLIPSLMDLSGCRKEEFCLGVQLKP